MDLQKQRVTIMGLGRHGGGVAVARYAASAGAIVTVTDTASAQVLSDSLTALADLPIARYCLGRHEECDFRSAEVLIVNPAVPPGNPWVALARANGAKITTELELFLRACPAQIVAVTGSNGKSTTTKMLAEMLAASGRKTWLGGNIGRSLLPELPQMTSDDWVALEVSSFQLAQLPGETTIEPPLRCLGAALVTNCRANHLDWHGDFAAYAAAKQRILEMVRPGGAVLLNPLANELQLWPCPADVNRIALVNDDDIPSLTVPGEHNRLNARCAAAVARSVGCELSAIHTALKNFRGLPHRLELVGEVAGRLFYNDSMATTPESVVVALQSLAQPVWLLAGGKDKGGDLAELAAAIAQHARGVCFYGAARERLYAAITPYFTASNAKGGVCISPAAVSVVETLDEAVAWCYAHSKDGDALLLSPACSSYDQFQDYEHRALHFIALMKKLAERELIATKISARDES
jgi:UDP-N-acetylmuramoylalanine--D-glutamate ligase